MRLVVDETLRRPLVGQGNVLGVELESITEGRALAQQLVEFAAEALHEFNLSKVSQNDTYQERLLIYRATTALELQTQLSAKLDARTVSDSPFVFTPQMEGVFPENRPNKPNFHSIMLARIVLGTHQALEEVPAEF